MFVNIILQDCERNPRFSVIYPRVSKENIPKAILSPFYKYSGKSYLEIFGFTKLKKFLKEDAKSISSPYMNWER